MRRKDKAIIDRGELGEIIDKAAVCRIAYIRGGVPYIVPVNFGYEDNSLYFHSATEGHKIDSLKINSQVCFEMETDVELLTATRACDWSTRYRSVIGHGRVSFIEETEAKRKALNIITRHYCCGQDYSAAGLDKVIIVKLEIDTLTGKKSGF